MMMNRNYNEIGSTIGLCDYEDCNNFVPIKIIEIDGSVYYLKECPTHGIHKRLISTDYQYYIQSINKHTQFISENPNCPNICGLCDFHTTNIGYMIVEITDKCDIQCATCIAASGPGNEKYKTVKEIEFMFDTSIKHTGVPNFIFISGGEPTIHPDFFQILDNLLEKVGRIFVISNGVRISMDIDFVKELSKYSNKIELYLQFDSIVPKTLLNIRGIDLREVRMKALDNLNKYNINTTLVCICKNGVNNTEINSIIDFALMYKNIRGVTIQPLKFIGRGNTEDIEKSYITLSDIRKEILTGKIFNSENLIPHFYDPENICIGYYDKNKKNPVTLEIKESLLLEKAFFMTPTLSTNKHKYENLFRVCIVSFFDRFTYNLKTVQQSAICFINKDGKVIPQNNYYIFYKTM